MSRLRAVAILTGFVALTLPLMPVQALLLRTSPRLARTFPNWYHRRVCALFGIRLVIDGEVAKGPVLLVANHSSWLDITVLSALAPVSFVAKREVAGWPFVASLARLQRTVFVDRERRAEVGDTASEMIRRLDQGDAIVLFAEGTSSDGNRVLPFRSSLFAAVKPTRAVAAAPAESGPAGEPVVQTVAVVYTHLHGLPLARHERPRVGWYGDMDMLSHAWELLQSGPLDVAIRVGPPARLADFATRKDLASASEDQVRETVVRILRGRPAAAPLATVRPADEARKAAPRRSGDTAWARFT